VPSTPLRLSLFWRTFALIAVVVAASLLAWLQLFRAAELQPRAERFAWEIASVVNLTRAGLVSAFGERRLELLSDLARDEGIRVLPIEPAERVEPWPDRAFGELIEAKLRELLGPRTRLAGRVNGAPGLWIQFEIDDDPYWMLLDPARLERTANRNWLGWFGIALGLAMAGALVISRVVNRPLADLASAIDRLSRGESPAPLREAAPTELAEVNRRFNRMASDLAALDQDRAEALAGISHDIRTPLTRLRMEIEMSTVDAGTRDSMADEIERIDAIVRQFVEFARPVSTGAMGPVDVGGTVRDVLAGFRAGPEAPRMSIVESIAQGTNWHGDAIALERILENLLENARRYGAAADGTVRVELGARRIGRGIELTVRDHGPGVPAAELQRLLRPFTRLDTERNRHGGSGLGLAIVTRIARRHAGDLRLELAAGGGLLARVTLADAIAAG
jgi:two-component system, OmpR family, osmolarity sensor histidine kinase EnvZ